MRFGGLSLIEFVRLVIVFLTKISELICKVVDVGSKGRTTLISCASFFLFICFDWGIFPNILRLKGSSLSLSLHASALPLPFFTLTTQAP